MALFDNNPLYNNISSLTNPVTSGLGGLFDGMNVFGTSIPTGVLGTGEEDKLRKQALLQGLLGTAATYLATPKNLNTGSALPYVGKAFLGGMGASQDVVDRAVRAKLLSGRDNEFSSINPLDVTPESLKAYQDSIAQGKKDPSLLRRAAPVEKPQGPMIVSPGSTVYDPTSNEARYTAPDKSKGFTDSFANASNILFQTTNPSDLTLEQRKQVAELAKQLDQGKSPKTNINMPAGQTEYEKTLGTIRAKQDVDIVETANKSKNNISKIDMTLNQIQNSDAITGFGADIQKNVNRFKAKVLKDAKAGKQVADTEILDAFLGSDVFPQIGALGIGAKGLDTPAEREFLRQVMTGTISMDKNALIKMTQIRRDIEKRSIDRYNSAVDSGELNDYFTSTKRQKKLIDIPDNSGFRIVP
jgi:hypothetical protein